MKHSRKWHSVWLTLLICGVASAAKVDQPVRIFAQAQDASPPFAMARFVTGDTVPASAINTILFTQEPCQLPLEDKRNVYRAWMNFAAYQLGCWYPTIDDGFVFIGAIPSLTHKSEISWEAFPRAMLHADGSATITEPHYDSATFMASVMNKITMRVFSHLHEKP